jgi:hypothetical protein
LKFAATVFFLALCALAIVLTTAWGVLAIHYSDIRSDAIRTVLAVAFGTAGIVTLFALYGSAGAGVPPVPSRHCS